MTVFTLLIVLVAISGAAMLAWAYLHHVRTQRREWSRYAPPPGSGTFKPVMCPHCRQRSYSERANREGVCPNCHQSLRG